jgi:polyisoprenoid-binding protein YceI
VAGIFDWNRLLSLKLPLIYFQSKQTTMKKLFYPLAAIAIIGASAFTIVAVPSWKISDDYEVKFSSKDPNGVFRGLKGNISFDEKDLKNSVMDVSIDVSTINTGNGMQNTHAKGEQWFDAAKYPTIKFTSSEITKTATGYLVTGVLEMRGVKKEIGVPFTFDQNRFNGSFEVNRNDFGLGDPKHEKVPPTIKIDLSVPVSKA